MSIFPLRAHQKVYRGAKEKLRREAAEVNAKRHRITEYVNSLAANDPREIQQYSFASIARELGVTDDDVRGAIGDGGYNGITFGVRDAEREALASYKRAD